MGYRVEIYHHGKWHLQSEAFGTHDEAAAWALATHSQCPEHVRVVTPTEQRQAERLVGKRVEIPVHYDMWMRGARTGVITSVGKGKPGTSAFVRVKMDHPQVRRRVRVWAIDWDYMKFLD